MKRTASAIWQGGLRTGTGALTSASGVLRSTPYSFTARFESGAGTNPEELLAAAHAGCFTMATAAALEKAGLTPQHLSTVATVTLEQASGAWTITAVHLELEGTVPGASQSQFEAGAGEAKANCPMSRVLKADITMHAVLKAA